MTRALRCFIERDGQLVPVDTVLEWAKWYETADRKVAYDVVGEVRISTIFLGLDLSFRPGDLHIYETMVFGGAHHHEQRRYASRAAALAGHAEIVEHIRQHEHGGAGHGA